MQRFAHIERKSGGPLPRCVALLLLVLLGAPPALAGPRLAPHPGGLGFDGPTDPQVTALWWNAAALGELPGTHLHLAGSPVVLVQQMDLASGAPGRSVSVHAVDVEPDLFAGITTDFTNEHVRFGFAYHEPFRDVGSLPLDSATASSAHYHRLTTTWRERFFSPAAAYRINSDVSFGVGMSIVWSNVRLQFDRPCALDIAPSCAGDERVDVHGSSLSVGFQAGFLWRILGRVTIGGAFRLRPGLSRITAEEYGSAERNAQLSRTGLDGAASTLTAFGQVSYVLPDIVHFGARWLVTDRLEAAATFRYADWGQRGEPIRIRLSSPELRAAQAPEDIRLYRGFQDSFGLSGRGGYCVLVPQRVGDRCRLKLGVLAGFDTGQYGEQAVSPDALDGPTLELGALFEWSATRHVRLVGGASYGLMVTQHVRNSVYNQMLSDNCKTSQYAAAACTEADMGRGIPSANGDYSLESYTASLALAFDWWP